MKLIQLLHRSLLVLPLLLGVTGLSFAANPGSISDLTALAGDQIGEVKLSWTAPGDDGNSGTADGYLVRTSTLNQISDEADFIAADISTQAWSPVAAGGTENRVLTGFTAGVTVYVAIKAYDATNGTATWSRTGSINTYNYARAQFMSTVTWSTHTTVVSSQSIKWAWIDIAQEAGYRVFNATSSDNWTGDLAQDTTIYLHTNLTPNTTYEAYVQAFESTDTLNSATTVQVTLSAIPSLTSSSHSTGTIQVDINANNNPSGTLYDIERSTNGTGNWVVIGTRTTTSVTDTNLDMNTTYYFRARAFNHTEIASDYSSIFTTITHSTFPINLRSVTQTDTTVDLFWDANGNPDGTYYDLERSPDGSTGWSSIFSGSTETTYTDTSLDENTTYYYRVAALNHALVPSTWSVVLATYTTWTKPGAISSLNATPGSNDGEIDLAWTAPGDDGSSGTVLTYVVKYATFNVSSTNFNAANVSEFVHAWGSFAAGGNPESRTVTGLNPSKIYFFAIKGSDEGGLATWAHGSNPNRIATVPDTDPPAPTGLSATGGDHEITLTWDAVNSVPDVEGYWLQRATSPSFGTIVDIATVPAVSVSTTDTGLNNFTTYYYRIRTIDTGPVYRYSSYTSGISTMTLDTEAPDAATTFTAYPGNQEGQLKFTWVWTGDDASTGTVVGGEYRIKVAINSGYAWDSNDFTTSSSTDAVPGSTHTVFIQGFTPGTTYYARLWMLDDAGNVSAISNSTSSWAQKDVTPPAVIDPITMDPDWHQVTLSWLAPGDDGGSGVLSGSYEIAYTSSGAINTLGDFQAADGQISISTNIVPGNSSHRVITGLTTDVTWYFSIRTLDDSSNASDISASTSAVPPNAAPAAFTLTAPADFSIETTDQPLFDWDDTTDSDTDLGDSFLFSVSYSTSSGFESDITTTTAGLGVSELTPQSLTEDTTTFWRVIAYDEDGYVTIGTPDPMRVRINDVNSSPSIFNLTAPADASIQTTLTPDLDWDDSVDSDPGDTLTYTVEMSLDSGFSTLTLSSTTAVSSFSPTGLIENTTYYWRVSVSDTLLSTTTSAFRFITNATDESPVDFSILTPTDDERLLTQTPTMTWESTTDPDPGDSITYKLTYSEVSTFLTSTTVNLSTTTYTLPAQSDNINLYWFVEALDDDSAALDTQSQETWHCYIDLVKEEPQAFSIVVPTQSSVVANLKPLFDWTDAVDNDPFDTVRYHIELSPADPTFTGAIAIPTGVDTFYQPINSLLDDTTYYWRVTAGGYQGVPPALVDSTTTVTSVYWFLLDTVNYPPLTFNLSSPQDEGQVNTQTPTLIWDEAVDNDVNEVLKYDLEISTNSDFSTITYSSSSIFETELTLPTKILENRTYHWRVTARDRDDAATVCAQNFEFTIPILTRLRPPNGLTGSFSSDLTNWTLNWFSTTENTDASTAIDLSGYNLYRSLFSDDIGDAAPIAVLGPTATQYVDVGVNGAPYYYMLRAFDLSDIESFDSTAIQASENPTAHIYSASGDLRLTVDSNVLDELSNASDGEVKRILLTDNGGAAGKVLKNYSISVEKESDNTAISDYKFSSAITVSFSLSALGFSAKALTPSQAWGPTQTAIYWHNGVEYVKLGGAFDPTESWIYIHTTRSGLYQVRQVLRASSFEVSTIWPKKTFTPNGDGINDTINFVFENPKDSPLSGKVFNLQGAFVSDLTVGSDGSSLVWDGKENGGAPVPKGVYIYQIEVEGKNLNGTIVVAR